LSGLWRVERPPPGDYWINAMSGYTRQRWFDNESQDCSVMVFKDVFTVAPEKIRRLLY
jgi:hypothetical protein